MTVSDIERQYTVGPGPGARSGQAPVTQVAGIFEKQGGKAAFLNSMFYTGSGLRFRGDESAGVRRLSQRCHSFAAVPADAGIGSGRRDTGLL